MNVFDQAAKPRSNVVRRVFIKRRQLSDGKFESEWQEITKDVKKFGKIRKTIDAYRPYKFTFNNVQLELSNTEGKYSPHDYESSLWYGYLNQQRTLVKIECAFFEVDDTTKEYKIVNEYPKSSLWDDDFWDNDPAQWDGQTAEVFTGVISGDIQLNDQATVRMNVKPVISIFEDYPAVNLTGFTSTGITASDYATILRDQQDSLGEYVFRPFLGDTTTNWDISTTSNVYADLNTSTSSFTIDETAWSVLEKLSEAENFLSYVTGDGVFKFVSRDAITTSTAYEFHGAGSFSTIFGNTLMKIKGYGFKQSKYYSRVSIKFISEETTTSYATVESQFLVAPNSNPWILGDRTLSIENYFFGNTASAETAANTIFNEVSALKREISFDTSLVLGLDIFDRFRIYYDPTEFSPNSLWDRKSWADTVAGSDDLVWDKTEGQQVILNGQEFKFLSYEIDLDNLKNSFIAREL